MSSSTPFLTGSTDREHDLLAVGSPLIDFLSHAGLDVVASLGLQAGAMSLIDGETAARIRDAVGSGETVVAGGTVANTASGVASLGGHPVYVGAVANDDLGAHFESDLQAVGVHPILEHLSVAPEETTGTGICYVIVTPDHQRTMATMLGVSGALGHDTITASIVSSASLVYFDGYMLDFADSGPVIETILTLAKASSTNVALGLADPFVVSRHGDRLRELIARVDLVFSNRDEAIALTEASNIEAAIESIRAMGTAVVVTDGASGAYLANADGVVHVDAAAANVEDTTGAGDLFAAGVCFGATHGLDAEACGKLGALCAAEAISHMGARPSTSLRQLAEQASLI